MQARSTAVHGVKLRREDRYPFALMSYLFVASLAFWLNCFGGYLDVADLSAKSKRTSAFFLNYPRSRYGNENFLARSCYLLTRHDVNSELQLTKELGPLFSIAPRRGNETLEPGWLHLLGRERPIARPNALPVFVDEIGTAAGEHFVEMIFDCRDRPRRVSG